MGSNNPHKVVFIQGEKLEDVESFKYLGSTISSDVTSSTEVRTRIAVATASLTKLQTIWKDENISIQNKIKLLRAIVISTALYGCESWTLYHGGRQRRIQAFELRCYRRLLGVFYKEHKTNEYIINEITKRGTNIEYFGFV
ncbi:uncharacterized protein [Amphiura filiformis]|uniref:uncharacterized protein n=1 Tax=Amphiura filiformis TaxID=82378 RepID=UPI003B2253BA